MSIRRRIFVLVSIILSILLIIWVINLFAGALGSVEGENQQPETVMAAGRAGG